MSRTSADSLRHVGNREALSEIGLWLNIFQAGVAMMVQRSHWVLTSLLVLMACHIDSGAAPANVELQPDLSTQSGVSAWDFDGSGEWIVGDGKLVLATAGIPGGAFRRPSALAILRSEPLKQASIVAQVRSMAQPDVLQRDLQVVVAYQSPSRFYYVHLSALTDAVHNGIFLVADADRQRIDSGTGIPKLVDQEWHDVQVDWDGESGTIYVYVDGSPEPVLSAADTTLRQGRVGFGSFDDTGEFRAIRVRGSSE